MRTNERKYTNEQKIFEKKEKSHRKRHKDTENTNFSSSFFENKLKVKCHKEHVKD